MLNKSCSCLKKNVDSSLLSSENHSRSGDFGPHISRLVELDCLESFKEVRKALIQIKVMKPKTSPNKLTILVKKFSK